MFLSKALPYFLLALVALLSVASASGTGYLQPRQDDDVSRSASESASSSSASASASRSSSSDAPSSSPPSTTPSSTPPPSSSDRPTTSAPPPSTTSEEPKTTPPPESSAPPSTSFGVVTVIVTTSGSSTYRVSSTIPVSSTPSATGVSDQSGPTSGGMSPQTKNVVIGVSVGVGGALILGALAIVFFRLRRKRNGGEDADELMSNGRYGHEKTGSVDNSPFKSTLDQYHNPAGRVNQSANF